jgi:DNA (cytosine-5)-methyltransferase 1
VADTSSIRSQEHGHSKSENVVIRTQNVADTDNSRQQEQWWQSSTQQTHQTFKCSGQWEFEPDVGRVAHGVPRRVDRLKGLGNAIVPQIAYQIGKAIRDAEEI